MMLRWAPLLACLALAACYPTTTRPDLTPLPDATRFEVEMDVAEATLMLALELDTDSIPVMRTESEDGWLETDWFDAVTLAPITGRPLGANAVKLRAFVHPSSADHSEITIEVVKRVLVNPAMPPRELEMQVGDTHPVMLRVKRVVERMGTSPPSGATHPSGGGSSASE